MKTKLTKKFWVALTLLSLIGQIAWVVENMYLNVFMYKMFNATAGDISAMVAASAVAATLTTVLIGALSDKIGRRKIFICGGYILWGISILGFTLLREDLIHAAFPMAASVSAIGITLVIVLDCVMTFFGSTANDAAFNA
ncbi:MAG: MFS transporter, partial [Clostridia bacterium]|nr:MFS transporter [Clostridia bacterium]